MSHIIAMPSNPLVSIHILIGIQAYSGSSDITLNPNRTTNGPNLSWRVIRPPIRHSYPRTSSFRHIQGQALLHSTLIEQRIARIYHDELLDPQSVIRILDFKQVFQFDSPQILQILIIFRNRQTRYKIFQKMTFFLTVFYHMLSNCSFKILRIFIILGGSETLAWNPEYPRTSSRQSARL